MLGRAILIFGEAADNTRGYQLKNGFEIKGFKILAGGKFATDFQDKDGGYLYVEPPSVMWMGRPYNIIYFNDSSRQKLEKRILERFVSLSENKYHSREA